MIAAVPVLTNTHDAQMSAHFGSAPFLAIINPETGKVEFIDRGSKVEHECAPVGLLNEKRVEAILCSGIGRGAVHKLGNAGIKCLSVEDSTLTLSAITKGLSDGTLRFSENLVACAGHQHEGGCH